MPSGEALLNTGNSPSQGDSCVDNLTTAARKPRTKDVPAPSLVELWKNSPAHVESYDSGFMSLPDGTGYKYNAGRRLLVTPLGSETPLQVMDTCEAPWAVATVDAAFAADPIVRLNPKYKLKVLERGAGLNIAATKIIDHLVQRGSGEYHVIELNEDVLHNPDWGTHAWKEWMDEQLRRKSSEQGIKYDIEIIIHEGDAETVTRKLADQKRKFNIVLSDTFPLEPAHEGVNDIRDVDVLAQILYKEGVFTFFAYYPGMEHAAEGSHLTAHQLALLRPKFGGIHVSEADVKPARGYQYLTSENGTPIKSLPVVTCTDKKNGF